MGYNIEDPQNDRKMGYWIMKHIFYKIIKIKVIYL